MDFTLSEEQQMLADSVARWLAADYDFDARGRLVRTAEGWSESNWARIAELGLLALNIPEEQGGLGASRAETLLVMEAFGRALVVEPYVPTAVIAASLIARAGTDAQRAAQLPAIAAGERRFALAALERASRYDLADIATRATRMGGDAWRLEGRKTVVLHGDAAHELIVVARTRDALVPRDALAPREGLTLFLVPRDAQGVRLISFPTFDGLRAAELSLEDVRVPDAAVLGPVDGGHALLEWAVDLAIAAHCAEAVGAMQRLVELTAEHLRTRRQFGQPLAGFQSLQHRLADMMIAHEQARSMALLAAARVDDPDPRERRRALSAAKAMIGRCGRAVGQGAIQLHGGMGMTDEVAAGHYFKRLTAIDLAWGNVEHHVERFGDCA